MKELTLFVAFLALVAALFAASMLLAPKAKAYDPNIIKCRSNTSGEVLRLPRSRYSSCPRGFYEVY